MSSSRDPRKLPVQERSLATVDAILTAVDILVEEGAKELTVSHIAKRAGVPLSSLYQYYSGLESVLAAWEERELEREREKFFARIASHVATQPPYEAIVRDLVEMCFDMFLRRRQLFKSTVGADFLSRRLVRAELAEPVLAMMATALQSAPDQQRLRGPNFGPMIRVATKAATNVAFDAVVSNLSNEQLALVRAETVKMITLYLIRDPVFSE